ncbi:MAG: hypothetical protein ACK43M_15355 [Allorhizobium sp.]
MRNLQSAATSDAFTAVSVRKSFFPRGTVKCHGTAEFRSQVARDVACLFDLDSEVHYWTCNAPSLLISDEPYICDFVVMDSFGVETLIDAPDRNGGPTAADIESAARRAGWSFRRYQRDEVYLGSRLRNAKDLLRYANYGVPLGDRLKLLAALEEHGTLTVAECLTAFSETTPVAGFAAMVLHGFLEVDLDGGLIGPGTTVKRITA